MAYSDFTLAKVREAFSLTFEENRDLFADIPAVSPSERLKLTLEENIPLAIAINSEKARSEFLIAPILSEVRRQLNYEISLFSGVDFNVEPSQGLNGFCDFILSQNREQYYISAPIMTVIEAKNENIIAGLGQCIAAMLAAQIFNQRSNNASGAIYGIVTTGTTWKFLTLQGNIAAIDSTEYYIKEIDKILGILLNPFQISLAQIQA
jgi:hypothetical protein